MAAVVARPATPESSESGPAGPVRTCIGCRRRVAAVELFRVVVASERIGTAASEPVGTADEPDVGARESSNPLERGPIGVSVLPDVARRLPGRGAWLHHDVECVEQAVRRRAFARALRVPGPIDPQAVRQYVLHQLDPHQQHDQSAHHQRTTAGDDEL